MDAQISGQKFEEKQDICMGFKSISAKCLLTIKRKIVTFSGQLPDITVTSG